MTYFSGIMMTKSLYAVAVFLIASVIVADAECELGPVKDVHFEMDKVSYEQWTFLLQTEYTQLS
jgi:hypothetical protein